MFWRTLDEPVLAHYEGDDVDTYTTLIAVLCAALGFLGGFLAATFAVYRKINENENRIVAHDQNIKTLFRDKDGLDKRLETCLRLHEQTIASTTKIIDQNNLLIQKIACAQ